jgi:hypothetical protein
MDNGLDPTKNEISKDPDKDGYPNLEEYHFGTNPKDFFLKPQPLCALPDVNGNGYADFAVLWWDSVRNGSETYVKDPKTGKAINEMSFDTMFKPLSLAVVDNKDTYSIASLGVNTDTGEITVRSIDVLSGMLIKNISFEKQYNPISLAVISDMNGNDAPEFAVLGVNSTTSEAVMQIKDAKSGASLKNVSFGKDFAAKSFAVVPNVDLKGNPGVAVLGIKRGKNKVVAQVINAKTGTLVSSVVFSNASTPKGFAVIPGIDGKGAPGLAVLGINTTTGDVTVQVKNAKTGVQVNNIPVDKAYLPRELLVVSDINKNHDSAFAILGVNTNTAGVSIQVINAKTGVPIKNIAFSKKYAPRAIAVLPDMNNNHSQELALLGVKANTGEVMLQIKDAVKGGSIKDISIP